MQVADDLNPLRVLQLFQAVSDLDCQLLDLRGRPEDLLMTVLPVPPLSIRPSVEMDAGAGSNEEDITVIVKVRPAPCSSPHRPQLSAVAISSISDGIVTTDSGSSVTLLQSLLRTDVMPRTCTIWTCFCTYVAEILPASISGEGSSR